MSLKSILSGSVYLILLQFVSRMTTFVLNQMLLPYVTADTIGIAMIQMDFMVNTILFFSREGIRNALFRSTKEDKSQVQITLVNTSWLSTIVGVPVTIGMILYFLIFATDATHYTKCVYVFGLSTWLELLIEPMFAVTQANLKFKVRVVIEGVAVFLNVLVSYVLTKLGDTGDPSSNTFGVLSFAYARLAFSIGLILGYTSYYIYKSESSTFKPRKLKNDTYFDPSTLKLSWSFTKQSLVKQLLNEGDKFIMSLLASASTQGIWAIVLNYGSLIARILFAPLEEIFRVFYSKMLSDPKKNIITCHSFMLVSLRFHSILGVLFICFGSYFAYPILHILIGEKWAINAAPTLSWFCYLVPLMGYNGVLEAFVSSVATETELRIQSTWMIVFMIIYTSVAYLSLVVFDLSTIGIIIANAVNFTLRISWCLIFVKKYYHDQGIQNLLLNRCFPNIITGVLGIVSMWYISTDYKLYFNSPSKAESIAFLYKYVHLGVAFLIALITSERQVFKDLKTLINSKDKSE